MGKSSKTLVVDYSRYIFTYVKSLTGISAQESADWAALWHTANKQDYRQATSLLLPQEHMYSAEVSMNNE